jgi:hypothetical protein
MKLFLVAGFDFGTSYSKVVLRDFLNEKLAKAVTFGTAASGLMPSYVRVSEGLVSGPTNSREKGLMLSYPKLIAADVSTSSSQFNDLYGDILKDLLGHLGVATLSDAVPLILTRYFLSILDSIHDFIRKDVDWNGFDPKVDELVVQVAVPTGLMADRDAKLASLIQESLVAATYMRRGDRKPSPKSTVNEIQRALDTVRLLDSKSRKELDGRCVTYPEVAAGVQTLLRSKNTPDGKYITLDVGAGTVDLNVFLRRSRNERSPNEENPGLDYWSCEVEPLGFARLKVSEKRQKGIHEKAVNPIEKKQLIQRLNICVDRLIKKAFKYQPYNTLSDGPSPWIGETMAYIWGGGAGHDLYPKSFLDALSQHKLSIHTINRLPTPNETFRLPEDLKGNFGRLAVAYGLSYYHINLDNVTLPKELKYYEEIYPGLIDTISNKTKNCHCKGNPDCSYCLGSGYINKNVLPINWKAIPNKQPTINRLLNPITKTKKKTKKVYQHNKNLMKHI